MNEMDIQILETLQANFPLSEHPYQILANELGIPVGELMEAVKQLIDSAVIRRIGASLDSRALGYSSTLAAVSVPQESIEAASEIIRRFSEVTHSYLRKDEFNIWFTIIARSEQRIAAILAEIRESLCLEESKALNLPVK